MSGMIAILAQGQNGNVRSANACLHTTGRAGCCVCPGAFFLLQLRENDRCLFSLTHHGGGAGI